MRKIRPLALVLGLLLAGNACDPDPYVGMRPTGKPLGEILGISSHMSRGVAPSWTRDFEIERLAEAGVRKVRNDFHWKSIEPADDEWHFEGFDVMVDQGRAAGLEFDAILDFGVDWAMPGGSHDEIDPEVWGDYVSHLAAHFADRIDVYEVWNEQNTTRFWKPEPSPEHYGRLLRASYQAVHAADPEATVLFGGMSPLDPDLFGPDGLWTFLLRVEAVHPKVCDWFDGLAIHPYTFLQQTMPERTVTTGFLTYPDVEGAIDHARVQLEKVGCPGKSIHLTEMGWPDLLISEDRQGAYLARGLLIAASRGVDSFYWYTFWDGEGTAELPTEDAFGLFTWPGEPPREKPSYRAMRAVHELLGQARFAGDLAARLGWPEELRALAFVDPAGAWTIAAWRASASLDGTRSVAIPLHRDAVGGWRLLDQEGAVLDAGPDTTAVELELDGRVRYLRFATEAS